jgi:two-component system sensor histidine kinase SenX3
VANVSHELKTPVGGLALLAEAVADAADDPVAVRRFAERMQQEAARLSAMVHDLLALSRLQADGGAQPATPVALDRVVTEAVDRCRTAASSRAITLDVRAERGLTVLGDEEQLVTAVRNLVDNAIAYSPPRTRVSVGLRQQAGTVEISVSDQGIGIPASDLERIFERFYRVDPARSRETGGTGLGLSIVKHTVANHGGEVTVWSREGIGSTFTVHLPLLETAPSPAHPTVDPARAANPAEDALSNALSAAAPTVVPTPRPNRAVVGPRRVGPPPALGWTVEETRP